MFFSFLFRLGLKTNKQTDREDVYLKFTLQARSVFFFVHKRRFKASLSFILSLFNVEAQLWWNLRIQPFLAYLRIRRSIVRLHRQSIVRLQEQTTWCFRVHPRLRLPSVVRRWRSSVAGMRPLPSLSNTRSPSTNSSSGATTSFCRHNRSKITWNCCIDKRSTLLRSARRRLISASVGFSPKARTASPK